MPLSKTQALACELISRVSVTPEDAGCQALMIERLQASGFSVEKLRFGEVENFWAVHGEAGPILAFAGHTDVVPSGNTSDWNTPPFEPSIEGDFLFGRGAADMKGSLAAMIVAAEKFVDKHPNHKHRLAFLITSDEEGPAINGTMKVVEWLEQKDEKIRWCLVGEPSSTKKVGDTVKNGRRGSLGAVLRIQGKQGHVAYPHLAVNPIHMASPALAELSQEVWDEGSEFFPPTSFQISNINSGTGATNVIPDTASVVFNFRFSTALTVEELKQRTETILQKHAVNYSLQWTLFGMPFITESGELVDACIDAIKKTNTIDTELSTAGGTSDGRFIAPTGAQVVELGPVNATIHKINECVNVHDLDELALMYESIMENLLLN